MIPTRLRRGRGQFPGSPRCAGALRRAASRARFDADLERIRAYLRLPSISATGEGIAECAQATAQLIAGTRAARRSSAPTAAIPS